jgi:hypothetical protein
VQSPQNIAASVSDRRILSCLFVIRAERSRLGPVALLDEPHDRTLRREFLRAVESSLPALWSARLLTLDRGAGAAHGAAEADAMAAVMPLQARWQARHALYLLNELRRLRGG